MQPPLLSALFLSESSDPALNITPTISAILLMPATSVLLRSRRGGGCVIGSFRCEQESMATGRRYKKWRREWERDEERTRKWEENKESCAGGWGLIETRKEWERRDEFYNWWDLSGWKITDGEGISKKKKTRLWKCQDYVVFCVHFIRVSFSLV